MLLKSLCKPIYPSVENVCEGSKGGTAADRIADELRRSIEQLQSAKDSVSRVYEEQSRLVDTAWHGEKLSIVPGEELLDRVCRRYGVRFKKKQGDSARLAALMQENDIDSEISEFIRMVGGE